ncbi:MAG: bifunctional serine/threonine-protein kinase/formylglycine-generating enzyme family protein [Planctomycetota bacterium]
MEPDFEQVRQLYHELCDRPARERAAILADPAVPPEVRVEVEALLNQTDVSLLAETALGDVGAQLLDSLGDAPGAAPTPDRIGPFEIVGVLGEGGMGVVYRAEQHEPVRRTVALKVIKAGMNSRDVVRRFELERQAQAVMKHPSIAQVLDAGTTPAGQPYIAMEYVEGEAIHRFCDRHRYSLRDRVVLFRKVCDAVQHAHNQGVIHRDLKPSNILVATGDDGGAQPSVIDFGLARAVERRVDASALTQAHQFMGTPAYMSPEQADTSLGMVDTRTDVYALGATLYELLTGRPPLLFGAETPLVLQRRICDEIPPRPSALFAADSVEGQEAATRRDCDVATLRRTLQGDLGWIVLRAIEKEPGRRYAMARELSAELGRYLEDLPVEAVPESTVYRIRKFVRRNRLQVAATAAAVLLLVAGGLAAVLFAIRASNDAVVAESMARGAADAREQARASLQKYDLVSSVVTLREARETGEGLVPAWPQLRPQLRAWLAETESLRAMVPALDRQLATLRADATSSRQLDDGAPGVADLRRAQARRDALAQAQAVRDGEARVAPVPLRKTDAGRTPERHRRDAWVMVRPDRARFGNEGLGLALARAAVRDAGTAGATRFEDALVWALFANGLDEEAQSAARSAPLVARLMAAIEEAPRRLAQSERVAARLEALAGAWRLPSREAQFLHDTLQQLALDLRVFWDERVGLHADVAQRLQWAERLAGIQDSVEHRRRWAEARAAVAASARYRAATGAALGLAPQDGLVPLGPNPKTGLWEFYHLRSAADPTVLPVHAVDGAIAVGEDTGIVFVLVPGRSFWMGAQRDDPAGPGYDPAAETWEGPVHQVELAPYFLARHEMTQSQWARLHPGEWPSYYTRGFKYEGQPEPISGAHPVEYVSWTQCDELLTSHGLTLPSEAQWEAACRAGTSGPWLTGATPDTLEGHANVLDEAAAVVPRFAKAPDRLSFADGYAGPAPVGRFTANPLGLFDLSGNAAEWVKDWYVGYQRPCRAGDGLREAGDGARQRVVRGGSCLQGAAHARIAYRSRDVPGEADWHCGLRAARAVLH